MMAKFGDVLTTDDVSTGTPYTVTWGSFGQTSAGSYVPWQYLAQSNTYTAPLTTPFTQIPLPVVGVYEVTIGLWGQSGGSSCVEAVEVYSSATKTRDHPIMPYPASPQALQWMGTVPITTLLTTDYLMVKVVSGSFGTTDVRFASQLAVRQVP
jgi:hypothetical protein